VIFSRRRRIGRKKAIEKRGGGASVPGFISQIRDDEKKREKEGGEKGKPSTQGTRAGRK